MGIREHINVVGKEHFTIILVHRFVARNGEHQRQIEDQYICEMDTMKNGLNGYRAFTTVEEKKQHKREYMQNNMEHVKKQQHEWIQNNVEHIKQHAGQKIMCVCGCEMNRSSLSLHRKSTKHITNFIIHA